MITISANSREQFSISYFERRFEENNTNIQVAKVSPIPKISVHSNSLNASRDLAAAPAATA